MAVSITVDAAAAGSGPAAGLAPAVFIDKDGTLIHDLPYNVDPARVRLREDAGPALARLQQAGYRLVLITNQAGLAHQKFEEEALQPVWDILASLLGLYGVTLDAIYYCPHHPQGSHPEFGRGCDCRKPAPGLLLRAARKHQLDLARSWFIGDILDDIEAGHRAGCRTVLLDVGAETEWRNSPLRRPDRVAASLTEAAADILAAAALAGATMEMAE
ncbi:HAD-IIIA family hydrolase [Azoarcus indigens]|uniref:D,D-heptose 1,7-bisphosphate phosphatase n=1 Tax=Azoarcus indigens TaxID=29545 RepID=A0A4R6DVS5_9RHOO|nr:HAD family hydrolase [Azoarcus indigens]NMG68082.1 HAD-IIIA family hydrolase [Azoarcus indigens]TDN48428.1 D,D-heptose 1,7-bisphosphate phosphatase [Azoarcus indigens]